MSVPPTFPVLPGLAFPVKRRTIASTRVVPHRSGREVRQPLYPQALYAFELPIEGLASDAATLPGLGASSLQMLIGLFLQCRGPGDPFLYVDPIDRAATAQAIGAGDGTTVAFPFVRTLGSTTETVSWVTSVTRVAVAGQAQANGWSLVSPNRLVFASPPAAGAAIVADFTFAYLCRFLDEGIDFEHLMRGLWQAQSVRFRSTTP